MTAFLRNLPALWHFTGAGIGFPQRSRKAQARYVAKALPSGELGKQGGNNPAADTTRRRIKKMLSKGLRSRSGWCGFFCHARSYGGVLQGIKLNRTSHAALEWELIMIRDTGQYAVGWFTLSLINAGLAQTKGRSGLNWWIVSIFLGPIATFLIVVLDPPKSK